MRPLVTKKGAEYRGLSSKGFTLLELLVVMALLGLMVGLSVPRLLSTVEAVSAGAEERALGQIMDQVKLHAFLRNQRHTFFFRDHSIVAAEDSPIASFEYIRFPGQRIQWNTKGFPDGDKLEYTIRGNRKSLALY